MEYAVVEDWVPPSEERIKWIRGCKLSSPTVALGSFSWAILENVKQIGCRSRRAFERPMIWNSSRGGGRSRRFLGESLVEFAITPSGIGMRKTPRLRRLTLLSSRRKAEAAVNLAKARL
jgi:hypothetical protein